MSGYPHCLYGLLSAARAARTVGVLRFSAIEFGVAEGNGRPTIDLYTSTRDGFTLFDVAPDRLLPRVMMYFDDLDDLFGYPSTTATAKFAAIEEFTRDTPIGVSVRSTA